MKSHPFEIASEKHYVQSKYNSKPSKFHIVLFFLTITLDLMSSLESVY